MLVKVIKDGQEFQYDSTKDQIAILLTPKDKEAVRNMPEKELLIVSAPFKFMADGSARVWQWAMTGWKGATYVDPANIRTVT